MEPIVFKPGQSSSDNQNNQNNLKDSQASAPEPAGASSMPPNSTNIDEPVKPVIGQVPVNEAVPPQPTAPAPTEEPAVTPPPTPKLPRKNKRGLFIGIALVLLAAAGGAFAYFRANHMVKPLVTADEADKDVAELRIGSNQFPFNAFYPDPNFSTGASFSVNLQMYEGLVGFKDTTTLVPLLADSWSNPDDTTWVFKIKQGVKFHDGKTMTAEDVRRSLDNAVKDENTLPLLVSTIDSVSVDDDQNVVIKTKGPDAILLNKLPLLFIQSTEKINGVPAGTGAYQLDSEHEPAEQELRLVAFDDHHLGRPSVRKLAYLGFETEAELVQAASDNKIDLTDYLIEASNDSEDIAGFTKRSHGAGEIYFLGMNAENSRSPLRNVKVRQAIQAALDAEDFIAKTGRNARVPSQMTVEANVGFNPDLEPIERDVNRAKQLLSEAGYASGVTISFLRPDDEKSLQAYNVLKDQLAEANIRLTDRKASSIPDFFNAIDNGEAELFSYSVASVFIDSYDIFAFNFRNANFDSSTLNELLDASNRQFDGSQRKTTLQQASRVIMEEAAAMPLAENLTVFYVRNNLDLKIDTVGLTAGGYVRAISSR